MKTKLLILYKELITVLRFLQNRMHCMRGRSVQFMDVKPAGLTKQVFDEPWVCLDRWNQCFDVVCFTVGI